MSIELLGADYHRNGIGGVSFYVALFKDSQEANHTFLAVLFVDALCPLCKGDGQLFPVTNAEHPECPRCDGTGNIVPTHVPRTAVLDVNMAAAGNIFMHPEYNAQGACLSPGGNAWRGADSYSGQLLPLIMAAQVTSRANFDKHFDEA